MPALTAQQRKIFIVASIAFGLLATLYVANHYYFQANKLNKQNKITNDFGNICEETFKENGKGTITCSDGTVEEGEFRDGVDDELSEEDLDDDSIDVDKDTPELLNKKISDENLQSHDPFGRLPNEVLTHILLQIKHPVSWKSVSLVNKRFHSVSQSPMFIAAKLESEKLNIPLLHYLQLAKQAGHFLKRINLYETSLTD